MTNKTKRTFSKDVKNFRGKRFSKDELNRIFNRVSQLYREKVPVDTMLKIMQTEGFRRVDGSNLTPSWVTARLNQVIAYNKSASTRHKSGPVREVYKKKTVMMDNADVHMEVLNSNLSDSTKIAILQLLSKKK